ncbi:MAG: orotate phosphoribosyltransferase [Arenicella sp.]|jgi:orotate phosphoribosyltransferase
MENNQLQVAKNIVSKLLEVGSIKINANEPFTWASGWKSPIYCDNRLSLSFPEVRSYIKESLIARIKAEYPEAEGIAGVATAGIPQGALVADALGLPFIYVRSSPKSHGLENMVEGQITPGQKIVVVEDLISTGGSSVKATLALRELGFDIQGLAAIFSYEFEVAKQNFQTANIPFFTLTDYSTLLDVSIEQGKVENHDLNSLNEWREKPAEWGRFGN